MIDLNLIFVIFIGKETDLDESNNAVKLKNRTFFPSDD